MTKHTPGLLIAKRVGDQYSFPDKDTRRIAAAWNACDGIPTEALESGVVKEMLIELVRCATDIEEATRVTKPNYPSISNIFKECHQRVLATITKAEGRS